MFVSVTVTLHVSLRGTLQVATPFFAVILRGLDIDCVAQETTMSFSGGIQSITLLCCSVFYNKHAVTLFYTLLVFIMLHVT